MNRRTGYQLGTGYDFPIGTAERRERDDEASEFGIGIGEPHEYCGTTPEPDRIINVDNDLRI